VSSDVYFERTINGGLFLVYANAPFYVIFVSGLGCSIIVPEPGGFAYQKFKRETSLIPKNFCFLHFS
jgi:predicted nucleotide-binding protein (sugar kinase/HSP70/actin superfamily)